ncbi:MAG: hypothetical protein AB1403_06955 [Candidatus Riflebacteria bacterium]
MASKKEWTWEYCGTLAGVKLSEDGNTLTWWASHVKRLKSRKKYVGSRSQSVDSFRKEGPSYDNITVWELKTGKEVFDFLTGLIKRGKYMHGMNEPAWLKKNAIGPGGS